IHTADWHLGNKMHEIDRTAEYKSFLGWLKTEIEKKQAEVLVIAGDIYDKVNPSTEAKKLYHDFLASLYGTCCKNVFIVAGNHDSSELIDSDKELLDCLNIHVVGKISGLAPEQMVFEIFDEKKNVVGICCAVPFASEGELRNYFNGQSQDGEFSNDAWGELYGKVRDAAEKLRNGRNIPVIATGHLYAADLEGKRSACKETAAIDDGVKPLDIIGNLGSVGVNAFPKEFDYVALGHIHYSTMVAKNPKVRYSGSPVVMGFDEWNDKRNVLFVDFEEKNARVEKIEIPKAFDFRRISGDFRTIKTELDKLIQNPPELPTKLELYYLVEEGIDIHLELDETAANLPENVEIANWKPQETANIFKSSFDSISVDEIKNLSEEEIFRSLILAKSPINRDGLDEDQIKQAEEEKIAKYLPLFMKLSEIVDSEGGK
ncbi:MAG: exonuclease subunit SbcD, partial [Treponema sp.]|nr:exonuclease subunit SbcD [Candidatus Treponema equifaecale]